MSARRSTLWRSVVDAHPPGGFALWVRAMRGRSGVYLLRASVSGSVGGAPAAKGEVLYVGESHRGALYGTLTRHFQVNRYRRYERDRVEARIFLLDGEEAIAEEARQIQRHAPRDNALRPPVACSTVTRRHAAGFIGDRPIVVVIIAGASR